MLVDAFSFEELALESAELLPDRDTLQPIVIGSFAVNLASVNQSATSGAVAVTGPGGGDVSVVSVAANSATIQQYATSGNVTAVVTGP